MQLITHPATIWLRNRLRGAGVVRPLQLIFGSKGYEERVDQALMAMIRPHDIVWDIGANVGYYTTKIAAKVGPSGHVYAFEPSPLNFKKLCASCAQLPNVTPLALGLSSGPGHLSFVQGDDDLGATSRIANAVEGEDHLLIEVFSGDELISSGRVKAPTAIKIDIEGHERQALEGLSQALQRPALHDCIVEVHFGLLAQAGDPHAPKYIADQFVAAGFDVKWPDASHIHATRFRNAS